MKGKRKGRRKEGGKKKRKRKRNCRLVEKRCSFLNVVVLASTVWASSEIRVSAFHDFLPIKLVPLNSKRKKREVSLESMTKTWQPSAPVTPFLIVSHFHRLIQERFMRIRNKHLERIRELDKGTVKLIKYTFLISRSLLSFDLLTITTIRYFSFKIITILKIYYYYTCLY